ncbi:MAG: DUF4178 domain-containing protein [Leptospirales bacterium]|nr:DUF4178 domain-containing protein [Leptospirales bacterium]
MTGDLECAGCGQEFRLYSWDSEAYGCSFCFSVLHRKGQHWARANSTQPIVESPLLEIGRTGVLRGIKFVAIAYLVRREKESNFLWREYCLQSENGALRWLAEVDGHWTLLTETTQAPSVSKPLYNHTQSLRYQGRTYKLFQKGRAEVVALLGEFAWPVAPQQRVSLIEYICPPYLLSVERNEAGETWFDGVYVEAQEVRKAFGLKRMPRQDGIAPNQPTALGSKSGRLAGLTVIAASLMFCVQLVFAAASKNEQVFNHRLTYSPNAASNHETTPVFTLPEGTANVELELIADLHNSWITLDFALTNEGTREAFESDIDLEYYSGSDSEGSWTEGDTRGTRIISSVPGGQYRLVLDAEGLKSGSTPVTLDVRLKRDVPMYGNLFIGMFLILALPLFLFWRQSEFNNRRWENR